jgi:Zn-dependent protease
MFGPSLQLFRWRGIRVELTLLGATLVIAFLFTADNRVVSASPQMMLALGIGAFISLFVHEVAHALVGYAMGARVEEIRLNLPGGITQFKARPNSWLKDFVIYLAGPAASLLLWWLCNQGYEMLLSQNRPVLDREMMQVLFYLANLNLFMAVYNALPCYPLDGGQAVQSLLKRLNCNATFTSVILMLSGGAVVADVIFDLTHILSRVYIGGIFMVVLAILIPVSSFNLFAQAALRLKSVEMLTEEAQTRQQTQDEARRINAEKAPVAFEAGCEMRQARRYEPAIDQFSLALRLNPDETTYLRQRAATFAEMGEDLQALVDYCQLIAREPKEAAYYTARAQVYEKLGQSEAAKQDLVKAQKLGK